MSIDYAKLTTPQKWQWHAEVYALRRIVLDVPRDTRTSPCDPKGEWFNANLVEAAERRYRDQIEAASRASRASTEAENAVRFADAERWRESPRGRAFLLGVRDKPLAAAAQDLVQKNA